MGFDGVMSTNEHDERIAEQDLLLAQWESIDKLNRERSQQRLQRIAELEEQLMIEKEFGMHYHAEFMKLFEKGVEQNEHIAELDIALDAVTIHVGRLQKEILEKDQRIAELEAVLPELCVDCYQIYYDMVEAEELGDD